MLKTPIYFWTWWTLVSKPVAEPSAHRCTPHDQVIIKQPSKAILRSLMMVCLCNTSIPRWTCTAVSYLRLFSFLFPPPPPFIFTSSFKESQADEYLHLEDHMLTRGCEVTQQGWWSTLTIRKSAEQYRRFINGWGTLEPLQEEKLSHKLHCGQSRGFGRLICEVTLSVMELPELGKLTATLVKNQQHIFHCGGEHRAKGAPAYCCLTGPTQPKSCWKEEELGVQ